MTHAESNGSPIQEVRAGVETIATSYENAGAADKFTWFIEANTGHVLSDVMWQKTQARFAEHLS